MPMMKTRRGRFRRESVGFAAAAAAPSSLVLLLPPPPCGDDAEGDASAPAPAPPLSASLSSSTSSYQICVPSSGELTYGIVAFFLAKDRKLFFFFFQGEGRCEKEEKSEGRGAERERRPPSFFSPFARRPPSGLMSLCFFLFFFFFLLCCFSLSLSPLYRRGGGRQPDCELEERVATLPLSTHQQLPGGDEGRGPRLESRGGGKKNDAAAASAIFSGRVSCLGLFVELFAGAVSSFSGFRASLAAPP